MSPQPSDPNEAKTPAYDLEKAIEQLALLVSPKPISFHNLLKYGQQEDENPFLVFAIGIDDSCLEVCIKQSEMNNLWDGVVLKFFRAYYPANILADYALLDEAYAMKDVKAGLVGQEECAVGRYWKDKGVKWDRNDLLEGKSFIAEPLSELTNGDYDTFREMAMMFTEEEMSDVDCEDPEDYCSDGGVDSDQEEEEEDVDSEDEDDNAFFAELGAMEDGELLGDEENGSCTDSDRGSGDEDMDNVDSEDEDDTKTLKRSRDDYEDDEDEDDDDDNDDALRPQKITSRLQLAFRSRPSSK